jgi:hypothetical protein
MKKFTKAATLLLGPCSAMLLAGLANAAAPTVEIEWATDGAGPISNPNVVAEIGDTLTASIYVDTDGAPVIGYTVEATFDASELAFQSATEHLPTGFGLHVNVGTGPQGLCNGLMFEALVSPPNPGVSGRFLVGEVELEVIDVVDDGMSDFDTGPCSGGADEAMYDDSGNDVSVSTGYESGGSASTLPPTLPGLGGWPIGLLATLLAATVWVLVQRRQVSA